MSFVAALEKGIRGTDKREEPDALQLRRAIAHNAHGLSGRDGHTHGLHHRG